MKEIIGLVLLSLFAGWVNASQLEPCPPTGRWHQCIGKNTDVRGNTYVGEFSDGRFHGQGILYGLEGAELRSGRWVGGELTEPLMLDSRQFALSLSPRPAITPDSVEMPSGRWVSPVLGKDPLPALSPTGTGDGFLAFEVSSTTSQGLVSPADGVLVHSGPFGSSETGLVIRHGNGLYSILRTNRFWDHRFESALGKHFAVGQKIASWAAELPSWTGFVVTWEVFRVADSRIPDTGTFQDLLSAGSTTRFSFSSIDDVIAVVRNPQGRLSALALLGMGVVRIEQPLSGPYRDARLRVSGLPALAGSRTQIAMTRNTSQSANAAFLSVPGVLKLELLSGAGFWSAAALDISVAPGSISDVRIAGAASQSSAFDLTTVRDGGLRAGDFVAGIPSSASPSAGQGGAMDRLQASPPLTASASQEPVVTQTQSGNPDGRATPPQAGKFPASEPAIVLSESERERRWNESWTKFEAWRTGLSVASNRLPDAPSKEPPPNGGPLSTDSLRVQAPATISATQQPLPESQPTAQSVVKPERRVALVFGNASYKSSPLRNPVNDATDFSEALRSLGFEVTLIRDASISQMREATRRFADVLPASDVALIYYAGHGVEVKGRNYLIPVTADIKHEYELEEQAYDAGRWLDMLEGGANSGRQRVNVVILDACRDNAFTRGWRSASRGLARMDAPAGTFIAFATAPGRVAADGDRQRNSPFTASLLKAMQQPNLPIELVFKEVRRMVLQETRGEQVPWDNSSLVGDFVFRVAR